MVTDWVLDASIAVKLVLEESDSAQVAQAIRAIPEVRLLAPSLLRYEVGNACVKKSAKGFEELLARLLGGVHVVEPKEVAGFTPDLSYYDAAYLALAIEQKAGLLTADERMRKAAKKNGVEVGP